MIDATFSGKDPGSAPAFTVSIESTGAVTVSRGAARWRGSLAGDALARIGERVASAGIGRIGDHVGVGSRVAVLTTGAGALTVRFEGDDPRNPEAWTVPAAGDLVITLARVALATEQGTLHALDTGLPAVIERAGVLLRYSLGPAAGERATVVVYSDGRWESWRLQDEWTGAPLRRARADRDAAQAAHRAVRTLAERLRVCGAPLPSVDIAHDPTDAMDVRFAVGGRLEHLHLQWGRASRNDAYLSPVPPGVPLALFNDAVERLRALRDFPAARPATTDGPAPRPDGEPSVLIAEEQSAAGQAPPRPAGVLGLLRRLFGLPPVAASAADPRIAWLRELRARMEEGAQLDTLARMAAAPPPRVIVQGNLNGDDLQMSFLPPLSARAFIEVMAIEGAVTYAAGTDLNVFDLLVDSRGRHPHPYTAPHVGPFEVWASLHPIRQAREVARWHQKVILDVLSAEEARVYHLRLRRLGDPLAAGRSPT